MNWDTLHLRFASSVRDSVPTAATNGLELSVVDRDAYLNYAYTEYVRLLAIYNPLAIDNIVPDLFVLASLAASSGVITSPADYGYFVDLRQSGTVITRKGGREFLTIKDTPTIQDPPTPTNVYYTLSGRNILILPTTIITPFDLSYISLQESIVQGIGPDILLGPEHWDTIIALAKEQYYYDKQEFQTGQAFKANAVLNSPFKIGAQQ